MLTKNTRQQLLRKYGKIEHITGKVNIIVTGCKDCGPDDTHHLYIYLDTGKAYCHKEGLPKNIVDYIDIQENGEMFLETKDEIEEPKSVTEPEKLPESVLINLLFPSHPAIQYLLKRNVFIDDASKLGFRWPISNCNHSNRLIIPFYGLEGEYLGFQSRDITGKSRLKYITSKGCKKSKILYNYNLVKEAQAKNGNSDFDLVVVEGPFDVIPLMYQTVALLGSSISYTQKMLINSLGCRDIYILMDPDTAGIKASDKIGQKLKCWGRVVVVDNLNKDPGDYSTEELLNSIVGIEKKGI